MKKNFSDHEFRDSDHSLWENFRGDDPDAFLRIYDEYADVLYSFGANFTKDKELIKDCIHDLFLDLYKYRKQLSETTSIRFYLFGSLKRKIIKEQKKSVPFLSFDPTVLPQVGKEESPAFEYVVIQREEADDSDRLMVKAWDMLSDHQKKILFLRFNQELSYSEIADLLQISIESVRTMVYRSLKILRSVLQDSSHPFQLLFFILLQSDFHVSAQGKNIR